MTTTKTRITYQARLCNSAGELDLISADDLSALARRLAAQLHESGGWLLDVGDTIQITEQEQAE